MATTESTTRRAGAREAVLGELLPPVTRRRPRIGLVSGGLGTYWPQFPGLLPQLKESAAGSSPTRRRARPQPSNCGGPTAI
jgi:L-arabinose isomerase